MPYYQAQKGDCFSSLAKQFGFVDYQTIFNHPQNSALKEQRKNPNILYPGDQVFIPDPELRQVSRPVDQKHQFILKIKPAMLRIRLENNDHQAYAKVRYRLTIDTKKIEGRTDGDGMIEQPIPPDATAGQLDVWYQDSAPEDAKVTTQLSLGDLDPVSEIRGVQLRLINLGFDCGDADGVMDEDTELALRDFQTQFSLTVTGQADDDTRAKLQQLHDQQ